MLPLIYTPNITTAKQHVKLVPHYADYEDINSLYSNKVEVINIQTLNVEEFVNQIVSSKYILSTSLHGLIIAHAYGVPALWIKKGYIHSSDFKFYDYFSSVNIKPYKAFINIDEILSSEDNVTKLFSKYEQYSHINNSLRAIQMELLKVAPFTLKEKYVNLLLGYENSIYYTF